PMKYSQDVDWNKTFFEQINELWRKIPLPNIISINNVNSYYNNFTKDSRDCYLNVSILKCENLAYTYRSDKSRDSLDSAFIADCELCYEVIDTNLCNKVFFSRYAENCINSIFLLNCRNISNSIACVNLFNKSYCILNKQYSKEEYDELMPKIISHMG
ncbi:MAG: hypothetical protein AAB593_00460, partial [Patescibacteria group bacterium]